MVRKRPGHVPALHEDVGAEAREPLHPERQVQLVVLLEMGALLLAEDGEAQLLGLHRAQRGQLQRDDAPVDPQERRREQEGTRAPAIRAGR